MNRFTYFLFVITLISIYLSEINATKIECTKYKLKNGRARMKNNPKFVRYTCNKGFTLIGVKYTGCIRGFLEHYPPICVNSKPNCKPIKDLQNGFVLPESNNLVVHFFCKPEYQLTGPNITICDGTEWLFQRPNCVLNGKEPETHCDFEREDLCGWTQDLNHDFDWERKNNGRNGHIMELFLPKIFSEGRARLLSPIFPKMKKICVRFNYYISETIGNLNMYIKQENDVFSKLKPVFSREDYEGNFWRLGEVSIENGTLGPFQIIFEGVRGKLQRFCNIAIDDFSLTEEECSENISETTETTDATESSSEIPNFYFETCWNRCGLYNDSEICSCTENCFDANTCCPDFLQFCLGSSVDYEDVVDTSTTEMTFSPELSTESTIFSTNSIAPTIQAIKTTEKAIEKITEKPTVKITEKTTKKTTTTRPKLSTKPSTILTFPTTVPVISTEILTEMTTEKSTLEIETEFMAKTEYLMQHTQKPEIKTNNLFIYLGIGCAALFVIISVTFGVILIKNDRFNCRNFRNNRNADSMSDVRFLASDEVLDFTWKRAESL